MLELCSLALATVLSFANEPLVQSSLLRPLGFTQAQRDTDVYNYVTTRLRLLKRNRGAEDLKSEIVNEIDFGALSPESLDVLRRLMTLCDKAITGQAQLGGKLSDLQRRSNDADSKALVGLGTAAIGVMSSGSLVPLLAVLPGVVDGDAVRAEAGPLYAQRAAELGADISALEFDLGLARGRIQSDASVSSTEFVDPGDYDRFLAAGESKSDAERVATVTTALERSPRMQPAALHLAAHFYAKRDRQRCVRYADKAIETSPRILRRDALRARAYGLKAQVLLDARDYRAAARDAQLGLADDPANIDLLSIQGTGLAMSGDYAAALPVYETLELLAPSDATAHYNLACCRAVAKRDIDGALHALRDAIGHGFSDVAYARADGDLQLLRESCSAEFRALTEIALTFQIEWSFFGGGDLVVTNRSAFAISRLDLDLTVSGTSTWTPHPGPRSGNARATIADLRPGQAQKLRGIVAIPRAAFESVRVVASGAQGTFEQRFSRQALEARPRGGP